MLEFECPKCGKTSEITGDDLPNHACDDVDWECPKCEEVTKIGWYATVESRE